MKNAAPASLGVSVSYFEWAQNKAGWTWTLDDVHERLRRIMKSAFLDVYTRHEGRGISMRSAAYAIALERIAGAVRAQGTYEFFAPGGERGGARRSGAPRRVGAGSA